MSTPPQPPRAVHIAVGSTNSAKLAAVEQAAASLFPDLLVEQVEAMPGVPEQPHGDDETARGALHRAAQAQRLLDADYGVGLESGVTDGPAGRLYAISWAAAISRAGRRAFAGSERFPLPDEFADRVRAGAELGPVIDEVLGIPCLGRSRGAISIVTAGRRDRVALLSVAALHALVALLDLWRDSS